jgi:23S rRNA (uracil1939-C5)-methyltransferase
LIDQLARIGKLEQFDLQSLVAPTVASPAWNYRNHVQFHLTPQGELGYVSALSDSLIPIRECHLPEDTINRVWPQLELEAIKGLERVGLRLGEGDDIQIILESSSLETPELSVEELDVSVVHLVQDHPVVLAGSQYVFFRLLGREFRVSAGSFFQVNTALAEAMVSHLNDHLPLRQDNTVLDLYCGVGLFSAFLAERVGRLIGIESSPLACDDFVANLDEFEHVELYEGAVEEILPALDVRPQAVVLDPPRAGLERLVLDTIADLQPRYLAYISCDPATLARDARRLVRHGYHPQNITPFDLFPQTYHIESISIWTSA